MTAHQTSDGGRQAPSPAPEVGVDAGRSRLPDIVITLVLLAVFGAALVTAAQWGFRAALVPLVVTSVGVGLAGLHLVMLALRRARRSAATAAPSPPAAGGSDQDADYVFATAGRTAWLVTVGWLAGFVAGLYLIGAVPAGVAFTVAYLRTSGDSSWRLSLIYAAAVGLALWLVLGRLLAVPMPEGLLF